MLHLATAGSGSLQDLPVEEVDPLGIRGWRDVPGGSGRADQWIHSDVLMACMTGVFLSECRPYLLAWSLWAIAK